MFRRLVLLTVLTLISGHRPAQADITTGLIARYPFDGNANDVSGNNNHGSLVGPVALTTDRFGLADRAYSFNGSSTYILVPASASLNSPSTACTQAGWVLQYGVSLVGSGFNPLLMKSNTSENALMYRMVTNPTYVGAAFNNWNTHQSVAQATPLNEWHHFATVFDGATLRCYYDGAYIGSQPMVMTITTDNRPLTIGADVPGVLEIFNGKIDDVCIYNRALTDPDIVELYNQATPTGVSQSTPPFSLGVSVPNPTGSESSVEFTLDSDQFIQLDVFDVAGRRVRAVESGVRTAGVHRVTWNGRLDNGSSAPSGVYFFRLQSGSHLLTSRIVRVR